MIDDVPRSASSPTPALLPLGLSSCFEAVNSKKKARASLALLTGLLMAFTMFAADPAKADEPQPMSDPRGHWRLMPQYSDEFNAASLDASKWTTDVNNWGDWSWRGQNVSQSDGHLTITMRYEPHERDGKQLSYTSGMIRSKAPPIMGGYFEARIKGTDRSPGVSPGFWLANHQPDKWTEIDIIEMQEALAEPQRLDFTTHLWKVPGLDGTPIVKRHTATPEWSPRDGYHVYGLYWDSKVIQWYVDGQLEASEDNAYFDQPLNVQVSMATRQPLKLVPSADGFPTTMQVDYVRVWQKVGDGH